MRLVAGARLQFDAETPARHAEGLHLSLHRLCQATGSLLAQGAQFIGFLQRGEIAAQRMVCHSRHPLAKDTPHRANRWADHATPGKGWDSIFMARAIC